MRLVVNIPGLPPRVYDPLREAVARVVVKACQYWCFFATLGHRWGMRELDLQYILPLRRKPYLEICTQCGATAVREG